MKLFPGLAIVGIALILWAVPAGAARTNLVQSITVSGTLYAQGASTTNGNQVTTTVRPTRLNTANIIQVLGASTGNAFTINARLRLITPLSPADDALVVVQDGTNRVNVSDYFEYELRSETMRSAVVDNMTGRFSGTTYDIQSLRLRDKDGRPDLTLHFNIRGMTTTKFRSVSNPNHEVYGQADQVQASMAGGGDQNGEDIVVNATVKISGSAVEVLP